MNMNEDSFIKQLNFTRNELNLYNAKLPVLSVAGLNYVIHEEK